MNRVENGCDNIKILVATHKKYEMPKDTIYLPVHVGAQKAKVILKNFQRDNDGKNISEKNPYFCELTALYWAWKNPEKLDADYIGLAHYRRHFTAKKSLTKKPSKKIAKALNESEAKKLLTNSDIILPKLRKYYIENLYDHYVHTMEPEPLTLTEKIIAQKYPSYKPEFDKLHTRTSAHMFNMFVMKKEIFNDYCSWLFDILFELEEQMQNKIETYSPFQARFFGRVSELLLDVYIRTNNLNYVETKVMDIEHVNWLKKGSSFISAKISGRKYGQSF